jgi:hypothetical protein
MGKRKRDSNPFHLKSYLIGPETALFRREAVGITLAFKVGLMRCVYVRSL